MTEERRPVAERVAELLTARGWLVATAEAASRGAVAIALTGIPGASRFYAGSVIAGRDGTWPVFDLPLDADAAGIARLARSRLGADVGLCVGPRSRDGRVAVVSLVGPESAREDVVALAPPDDAEDVGDRVLELAERWLGALAQPAV